MSGYFVRRRAAGRYGVLHLLHDFDGSQLRPLVGNDFANALGSVVYARQHGHFRVTPKVKAS
jgi:hypothetical protein